MIKSPPRPIVQLECRILAVLCLNGRMSIDEIARLLTDVSGVAIERAVCELVAEGRLGIRIEAVHYRAGDAYLRRDLPVYFVQLQGGGA